MSAELARLADAGVSITGDDVPLLVRFDDRLVVGQAPAVRRIVTEQLERLASDGRVIIDLSDVIDLDAAGLAAVTAPVFAAIRRSQRVTVLPPTSGSAKRFADIVGILPIGVG